MRQVQVATFSGPLDLLLQLIEQQELDVSKISLAKVTEQYITALQQLTELPIDELADFLVVAAKLLLIKSRLMIPDQVVEDEGGLDLESQLKMYQAFVEASKVVGKLYNRHKVSYARESWRVIEPIFNPPEGVTVDTMRELIAEVLRELEPIMRLPQTVMIRTINIRQKIEDIKQQLLSGQHASFHSLLQQSSSRTDVIVTFLAMLELVKLRTVSLTQDELYADVRITVDQNEEDIV